MNYLSYSPFNLHITLSELDFSEDKREKTVDQYASVKVLLPLFEEDLDRKGIDKLTALVQGMPQTDWFILINSERNLHLLPKKAKLGVYVPTNQLIHHCIYFNRDFNFGYQIDLLRRLFVLDVHPFVVGDASTVTDANHYLEMVASFSRELFFIRETEEARELLQLFHNQFISADR